MFLAHALPPKSCRFLPATPRMIKAALWVTDLWMLVKIGHFNLLAFIVLFFLSKAISHSDSQEAQVDFNRLGAHQFEK